MHHSTLVLLLLAVCLQAWSLPLTRDVYSMNPDYVLHPGIGYYKFYKSWTNSRGLNWTDAQQICAEDGGHLPVVNSQAEFDLLYALFQRETNSYPLTLLGFHDLYLEGSFTTISGQPLNSTGYSTWGRPECQAAQTFCRNGTGPQSHCGAMSQFAPGLFVQDCSDIYPFFCELELWHDYELNPGMGYYKLHREGRSWGEAWRTCQEEGAHLAILNLEQEHSTLQGILARYPSFTNTDRRDRVDLGFHNKFNAIDHHTIFGELLNSTGYLVWNADEPSGWGNCGGLVRTGQLYIGSCYSKLAFICEHPGH